MSQTIVLVRHGKANPAQEGQPDAERTLTTAGKRSLKQSLPLALAPLKGAFAPSDIAVLTSPYIRARQTAEFVCAELGVEKAKTCKVLAGDDPKAMLAEARGDEHKAVVLVGHTPSMDKASQLLCGTRLPFKPGGVACFELIDEFNSGVNLRWFSQGPQVERWERSRQIEQAIARANKVAGKYYRAFIDNPSDVEALHDLRISFRVLRSLFIYAKPWLKGKSVRAAELSLRGLTALTSRLREYDVIIEQLAEVGDPADNELMTALRNLRNQESEKTLSAFALRKSQRALDETRETAKSLPWKGAILRDGIPTGEPEERFRKLCEAYYRRADALDLRDIEETHAVRKEAKRLRYITKSLGSLVRADDETEKRLRDVQDWLGELCDARASLEIIGEMPKRKLTETARASLERLRLQEEARELELVAKLTQAEIADAVETK